MQNSVINSSQTTKFLYTGPSMLPTFHSGDELKLQTKELSTLHRGDVAVFEQENPDPEKSEPTNLVHRVVAKRDNQWLTRGDNNLHLDPEPLCTDTFVGLVVSRQRDGRNRPVLNGFPGWIYAQALFILKSVWFHVKRIFQPLYAILRNTHLKHPRWKPTLELLTIHTPEHGALVKTLYRGRTVARYWLRTSAWNCQKPFDLIIERPTRSASISERDEAPVHEPG